MIRSDVSVRSARVQLALALLAADSTTGEGPEQLRRALVEPGETPSESEIRGALAVAAERADDPVSALRELLAALDSAPATSVDEPAAHALRVLDDGGPRLARDLTGGEVSGVFERAQADGASAVVVKLAALIALQRGDAEMSSRLLEAPIAGDDDPAVRVVRAVTGANALLDAGDPRGALAVTGRPGDPPTDGPPAEPALAAVQALSLYALGEAKAALATVGPSPAAYDGVVVRALALLWEAAGSEGPERAAAEAEAVEMAGQAARLEPSAGDALLLRGQAMLEGSMDLDEGRRLLRGGLRRLDGNPEQVRWWRIQERLRTDERYHYVTLELDAARERHEDVVRHAEEATRAGLEALQNAATDELVADALLALDRPDEAAQRAANASELFRLANDLPRAVTCGRRTIELAGVTVGPALALASMLWQTSVPGATAGSSWDLVEEGLRLLDQVDPLLDAAAAPEACYTRGLLLARRLELDPRTATRWRWEALPWLQARYLAEPDAYPAVHLSWALNNARLNRAALHFSERAFAFAPSDPWAKEVVVANRFNWWAELDEATRELLAEMPDVAWRETVDAFDCLVSGDEARLCPKVDQLDATGPWAVNVRAHALARCGDLDGARALFQRLVDEQDSYVSAADAAVLVGDLDLARRLVVEGETAGAVSPDQAAMARAFVDLLDGGDGDPVTVVVGYLRRARRPFEIATLARVLCPTIGLLHGHRPGVADALAAMQAEAERRLTDLPRDQPLLADFDAPLDRPGDEALVALVRDLLSVEAHLAEGEGEAAASLAERLAIPERRALALLLPAIAARARAGA